LEVNLFKLSHIVLAVIFIFGVVLTGCNSASAAVAKDGDTVQVDYTGKLADGTVFDTSIGKTPFEFTLGSGQAIDGFDRAVLGMKVGEKKTVTIPAADAYGPYHNEWVQQVPRDFIKIDKEPAVGDVLIITDDQYRQVQVLVTNISDNGTVTLDANHPLAGKDLTFEIELLKIN